MMKALKIIFGSLSALWALALIPSLFAGYSGRSDLAFSHHMGAVVGVLIGSAISFSLFRSARST